MLLRNFLWSNHSLNVRLTPRFEPATICTAGEWANHYTTEASYHCLSYPSTTWQDKISNDEMLTIVDESRCFIKTIGERKKNWIGHVLRGDGLLRDVLEGRMLGRRPQERPRMGMLDELREIDM